MPRFQHSRQNRSTSRPNRDWAAIIASEVTNVPAASKVLLGTFSPSNAGIDETVLRTVGIFGIQTDGVASSELQLGAVGIIVSTAVAAAAGVASLPGPVTQAGDEWFVYMPIVQSWVANGVGERMCQYHFDSKAKRIIQAANVFSIVVENSHASEAFDIAFSVRVLSQVRGTH